ncbi:MAG: DMT family transporter [Candidatus Sericytochromatia bacterium]
MLNSISLKKTNTLLKENEGIKFIIISSLFFSFVNILVKKLDNIPSYEIAFFRALISVLISYYTIKKLNINPWGNNKKILILRGIFGTAGLLIFFFSIKIMPLATATTLQYMSPIFSTLLAFFILKERTKVIQWIFFIISFIGAFLLKGIDSNVSLFYILLGMLGASMSGFAYNYIRKLKDSDHPLVIVFYFPLVSMPILTPYTLYNWINPNLIQWIYLLFIGIFTQIAQLYMTKAYQSEKIAIVSNFSYIGAIFSIIGGYFIFNEIISFSSILGMFLIIIGAILSSIYK